MRLNAPINELVFADGQRITLENDSIVVFVGPNNAGKTTCLHDIYSQLSGAPCCGLVAPIDFSKPSFSDVKALLDEITVLSTDGSNRHEGMGFKLSDFELNYYGKGVDHYCESMREMIFHFLTTDARLSACNPEKNLPRTAPASGPINMLVRDPDYLSKVSAAFSSAFGCEVTPNYFAGGDIPLCLGPTPVASEGTDLPRICEQMNGILGRYPLAHRQGDGMRSFLGIVLYLYIDHYSALFIDEPESFLHPPQAELMGSLIASDETAGRQLFISTHNKDLLNGMLGSGASRMAIVRVTRSGSESGFSVLGSDDVASLSSTTLLKYTDLVNALFHDKTVLCESDSDCMFYRAIWDVARAGEPAPLFLPVGGKARFKVFAGLLSKLGIDYTVVADADILRDPGDFKQLLVMGGSSWKDVSADWKLVKGELGKDDGAPTVAALKAEIDGILEACKGDRVSKNDCGKIRNLLDNESGWDNLKKHGFSELKGPAHVACKRIDKTFASCGVRMVPVGELERFVHGIASHGPSWVSEVFQRYPDLNAEEYSEARKFVSSWR